MLTLYYQDSLATYNIQWFKQVLMKLILSMAMRTPLYVHAKSLTNTNTTQVTAMM